MLRRSHKIVLSILFGGELKTKNTKTRPWSILYASQLYSVQPPVGTVREITIIGIVQKKEWHGQLECARDQSEELHLSLLYNSKGYTRLHHLNQEQIKAIKESQLAPEPRNSTKTPYIDLGRDIEAIPEQEFKTPPPGMGPP